MSKVKLTIDGPTAEICLDSPAKLNALTFSMLADLDAHCGTIERSADVQVVLLTASPSRAFCAGADIREWGELSATDFARHWVREGHRVFDRLARLAKSTIAVVNAHAFGGGLELISTCDIRVMAPDATLSLPETGIGIIPGWSGTQRLRRLLPEPVVKEMALFGTRLSAGRAHALGFVATVADDPRAAADDFATRAVARSATANEVAKYMIHAGAGEDTSALIEALGGGLIGATPDRTEGVAAFREKRRPSFSGQ